jgi:hypothetical protein
MDTETVLKIIAMLDARVNNLQSELDNTDPYEHIQYGIEEQMLALRNFNDHLQKYMHSLQNQVENEMNRGE